MSRPIKVYFKPLHKSLRVLLLIFALFLFSTQAYAVSETQIKAVFLEKFTHLIEWPGEDEGDFVICVLNDDNFASALEDIYGRKKFKGREVKIVKLSKKDTIPACKLLFFGKGSKGVKEQISALANKPVLTMTDDKEYVPEDVMITMYLNKKRFKYIINNKAAQAADIKISYLLLKSAQEVIK